MGSSIFDDTQSQSQITNGATKGAIIEVPGVKMQVRDLRLDNGMEDEGKPQMAKGISLQSNCGLCYCQGAVRAAMHSSRQVGDVGLSLLEY